MSLGCLWINNCSIASLAVDHRGLQNKYNTKKTSLVTIKLQAFRLLLKRGPTFEMSLNVRNNFATALKTITIVASYFKKKGKI